MTTRITEDNITPGSITANSIAEGISLGGGGGVTVDQIIVTDSSFANTSNTEILATGDYFKIYGSGFQANANVYLSTTFLPTTELTANIISDNEIHVTLTSIPIATFNLFLINTNGSTATKINAITSYEIPRTHGWFGGGVSSTIVDRIDFNDDTVTASVKGPLSLSRYYFGATGNDNYGWFTGGVGATTYVDRITYVADTATATVRGPLSQARSSHAGMANDNYGWLVGGAGSNVERIDFAADSSTSSARGFLTGNISENAATGTDDFGWAAGGGRSSIDRITYASDTGTASSRGPLTSSRNWPQGAGNNFYGWFAGGSSVSTVNRITYSSDLEVALIRGPLGLSNRTRFAGVSNNVSYGWFGGALASNTRVDRIDFNNDTEVSSVRGPLAGNRYGVAASSGKI